MIQNLWDMHCWNRCGRGQWRTVAALTLVFQSPVKPLYAASVVGKLLSTHVPAHVGVVLLARLVALVAAGIPLVAGLAALVVGGLQHGGMTGKETHT